MLDSLYITVFNHYKRRLGKRSLFIALLYINLLELSLVLSLGAFFKAFANQMQMMSVSQEKLWVLFSLIGVFIVFKNWMRYNGKRRTVLNAKSKPKPISIYLLWLMPIGSFIMAFVLLQVP
ncbi:MAG: hypothetical protein HKN40_07900 [Winogradskyella sp.]|uniref:hypothetical protein n=1 Tax=Winogradskyella sp. TaxID=1883156 RepID=UPI001823FF7E|nr:hypothetical protein [Winogradskyella sp.]